MSIACAHPSKWTTGPIITLWVLISILTLINTTYLQLIKSYTEYFLDLNACCKVAVNWNRRYLVSGGDNIFFIVVYFWLTFSVQSKILIATFSCRVICAVIAWLCLAGTAVDLFVVQGSWKFWVTAEEPRQAEESDFRISSNQTEPLLINNGLSESTGLRSVQYMQPSLEERGNCS